MNVAHFLKNTLGCHGVTSNSTSPPSRMRNQRWQQEFPVIFPFSEDLSNVNRELTDAIIHIFHGSGIFVSIC